MRTIDYDSHDSNTGNSETQMAVDVAIDKKFGNEQRALEEGFAASNGVRGGTAETNGRVKHPEKADNAKSGKVYNPVDDENPGLADN